MSSAGCGKTSTLTFGTVPSENANATPGSGNRRTRQRRLGDHYERRPDAGLRPEASRQLRQDQSLLVDLRLPWERRNSAQVDNGGANGYFRSYWGLQRESKNGAIFVAPEWLSGGWADTGGRIAFADDMVKPIEDNYCVDMRTSSPSGFSYGGGMSYELACARARSSMRQSSTKAGSSAGATGATIRSRCGRRRASRTPRFR